MPLYDDPDAPEFARLESQFAWIPAVLEVEYGERDLDNETPTDLNWLLLLPEDPRYDLDEVECSLAYENPETGYACTIWDASGEDDLPWAVLVADDFGVRLLPEYSVLNEDADETTLESALARAAEELPDRLTTGEFDRTGEPIALPDWLLAVVDEEEQQ